MKPFRPPPPRKIPAAIKVLPRTKNYSMIGNAFDYLLRFEIQRRSPHAKENGWIADWAPFYFKLMTEDELAKLGPGAFPQGLGSTATQASDRASKIVEVARREVEAYLKSTMPTRAQQEELARHAIRLAKLEPVFRALWVGPYTFEEPDPDDVRDLLDLLEIVPFNLLLHDHLLLLNPTFGESSRAVGGADTDLIAGEMLIDFKTTKRGETQVKDLDQLLGYFLLVQNERRADRSFPAINRLGLYYCRHGYLRIIEPAIWLQHPHFGELDSWFFAHAREVFGR